MSQVRFVIYKDIAGYHRWHLKAGNGEIIAVSEAYNSKQGAINSAYNVKQLAGLAIVVDSTI